LKRTKVQNSGLQKDLLEGFVVFSIKLPEENDADNQSGSTKKKDGRAFAGKGLVQQKILRYGKHCNAHKRQYRKSFCHK
jgi:hypothetical protein